MRASEARAITEQSAKELLDSKFLEKILPKIKEKALNGVSYLNVPVYEMNPGNAEQLQSLSYFVTKVEHYYTIQW